MTCPDHEPGTAPRCLACKDAVIARERRALKEARECLRYIEDGAECEQQIADADENLRDCFERDSDTPCAPCAARAGLKRIAAIRKGGR